MVGVSLSSTCNVTTECHRLIKEAVLEHLIQDVCSIVLAYACDFTGKPLMSRIHPVGAKLIVPLPNGNWLLHMWTRVLEVWNQELTKRVMKLGYPLVMSDIDSAVPISNGLVAAQGGNMISVIDTNTGFGSVVIELPPTSKFVRVIAWDEVIATSANGRLQLWQTNGQPLQTLVHEPDIDIADIARTSLGQIACVKNNRKLDLWDLDLGTLTTSSAGMATNPKKLAALPSNRIAIYCASGDVVLWDLTANYCLNRFTTLTSISWAAQLEYLPSGNLVTLGPDRVIKVWRVPDGSLVAEIKNRKRVFHGALVVSQDGSLVSPSGRTITCYA